MAVCAWCQREMQTAATCTVEAMHRDGKCIEMIPWGKERGRKTTARCGDCNVTRGGFHHPGCDMQRCPLCRRQMVSCGCRFDEDGPVEAAVPIEMALPLARMADPPGELVEGPFPDANGDPTEIRLLDTGDEATIHYVDVPEGDVTVVRGIPCTTALRTVIDLAPSMEAEHLGRVVDDALRRELFTVEEARARLAEPDMAERPGAMLLAQVLPR